MNDKPAFDSSFGSSLPTMPALRPPLLGTRHMVVAGNYLAAHAGFTILEAGGNAIDAGVAAGIALGVVHSDLVNVAGVAPIIIYLAETNEVQTISGLGTWPRAVRPDQFAAAGKIPHGVLRTVVPAAPDAWITALERFGTMSFSDVAAAAIRFASEGFVMYPLMAEIIAANEDGYRRWPENERIYLPSGRPPQAGELFVQSDLGARFSTWPMKRRLLPARDAPPGSRPRAPLSTTATSPLRSCATNRKTAACSTPKIWRRSASASSRRCPSISRAPRFTGADRGVRVRRC